MAQNAPDSNRRGKIKEHANPDVGCAEGVGKEPPVPEADVLRAIKSLAPFVARMGPAFEALALQKHSGHPAFRFLYGGEGAEYYRWQVCISPL